MYGDGELAAVRSDMNRGHRTLLEYRRTYHAGGAKKLLKRSTICADYTWMTCKANPQRAVGDGTLYSLPFTGKQHDFYAKTVARSIHNARQSAGMT